MKTITCDSCALVLKEKELRLIAEIRFGNDEKIIWLIGKKVIKEFCTSKCLKEFIDLKLWELVEFKRLNNEG